MHRFASAGEMQRALQMLLQAPSANVSTAPVESVPGARRVSVLADRPRWSSRFRVLAILALVFSTAAALLIRNVPSTAADQRVTVPKVAGLSLADARAAASAVGLTVQVAQQEPTLGTPAGEVVTQDPHEDLTADRGTTIQVVMSQGVQVPDLVGSQCASARSRVTASGWTVRPVRWRIANVVDFGKVVAQDPAANAVVAQKGEIQVQVAGPVGPC